MAFRSDQVKKGIARAPQRALLMAMGRSRQEIARPFVGVANSFCETVPGHIHLDRLAARVKEGVASAGGAPFEFNTIAICDGLAMGHTGMHASLPSREVVADSVELMALAHGFDALVLLASCDKIVPGMLMAAARLDIPAVMVTGGPMVAGSYQGEMVDLITVFEAVGKTQAGLMSETALAELEAAACPGAGSCAGMFTANTMACTAEALGMSLPGCACALAEGEAKDQIAYDSGRAVMALLEAERRPSHILTREAFENACRVDLALGGSTNTALHLPAIAAEARVTLELAEFDRLARTTPHLASMSPAGPMRMEHLEEAGGVGTVMYRLGERINLDALAVNGGTIADYLPAEPPAVERFGQPVIHTTDDPVHAEGSLAVLFGNLAPQGSVVKQTAVAQGMEVFRGPARVFDSEEAAVAAYESGGIKAGDVIVVRYEGPAGGPGMREMLALTSMISGGPLDGKVALITDGRFSGGSRGVAVGHISPEAALGGLMGLLQDGDPITIDIPQRKLEAQIDPDEAQERLRAWQRPEPKFRRGALARYANLVTSAAHGAVLAAAAEEEKP